MSNFQEQKKQYELPSDLIEEFLSMRGFVPKLISDLEDVTVFEKEEEKRSVKIPRLKRLNKQQIEKCLIDAGLTFTDLDIYIEHLKAIRQFEGLCTRIQLASNKTLEKMIAEVDDMGDISLVDCTLKALLSSSPESKLLENE